MGWLEYRAECWKNGRIDRKAELIRAFTCNNEDYSYEVLRCSMKGTVGYMAVRYTDKKLPEKNHVFGVVCLTSVSDKYFFAYKDMDESMGPYYYDCPVSILNLLSPTSNELALEWRQKCMKNSIISDNMEKQLTKAKEGSIIKVTYKYDTSLAKEGDTVTLEKRLVSRNYRTNRRTYQWITNCGYCYRMSAKMIADNNPEWVNYIV